MRGTRRWGTAGGARIALLLAFCACSSKALDGCNQGFGNITNNPVASPLVHSVNPVQPSCLGERDRSGTLIDSKFRLTFLRPIDPTTLDRGADSPVHENDDFRVYVGPVPVDGGALLPDDPSKLTRVPVTGVALEFGAATDASPAGVLAATVFFDPSTANLARPMVAVLVLRGAPPADGGAPIGWQTAATPLENADPADAGRIQLPGPVVSFVELVSTPDIAALPRIASSSVLDGEQGVEPHRPIDFSFDRPECFVTAAIEPVAGASFALAQGGLRVRSATELGLQLDTDYQVTIVSSTETADFFDGVCVDGGRCDEFPPTHGNNGLPLLSSDRDGGPGTSNFRFRTGPVKFAAPLRNTPDDAVADITKGDLTVWEKRFQEASLVVTVDDLHWGSAAMDATGDFFGGPYDRVGFTSDGLASIAFQGLRLAPYPFVGVHTAKATWQPLGAVDGFSDSLAVNFPRLPMVQRDFFSVGESDAAGLNVDETDPANAIHTEAVRAYVQDVQPTSAVVRWRTTEDSACVIRLVRADGDVTAAPACAQCSVAEDLAPVPIGFASQGNQGNLEGKRPNYRYVATIHDLNPGTFYAYRVECQRPNQLGTMVLASRARFKTPSESERTLSFLASGDYFPRQTVGICDTEFGADVCGGCIWNAPKVENGYAAMAQLLGNEIADLHLGYGDISHCDPNQFSTSEGEQYVWGILYRMGRRGLLAGTVYVPVAGNHDYDGPPPRPDILNYFSLPEASSVPFPAGSGSTSEFFSFEHGPAHFLAFNDSGAASHCNELADRGTPDWTALTVAGGSPALDSPQAQWVHADLDAATSRPWTIAYTHVPLNQLALSNGVELCPGRESTWFERELRDHHVPLAIFGHTHDDFRVFNACPLAGGCPCPNNAQTCAGGIPPDIGEDPVLFVQGGSLGTPRFGASGGPGAGTFAKVDIDGDTMLVRGFFSELDGSTPGGLAPANLGDGVLRPAMFALKRAVDSSTERRSGQRRVFVDRCVDAGGTTQCPLACWWPSQLPLPTDGLGGICLQ